MQVTPEPHTDATPVISLARVLRTGAFLIWLRTTTFIPAWVPRQWRSLSICYILATGATLICTFVAWVTTAWFPHFPYHSVFLLLGTLLVALTMGSGPGLLAAVLSALLLDVVIATPQFTLSFKDASEIVGFTSYLVVAIILVVLLSQERAVRRYAEATVRARDEARQVAEALTSITGHELRTPLTSMLAALQLSTRQISRLTAAENGLAPEQQEHLARIQDLQQRAVTSAQRMNRLVGDLLDVSRIRVDRFELVLLPADLGAIVEDVVQDQRQMTPERQISLVQAVPKGLPILLDADRIRQVLLNFLSNADRYSPAGAPIDVTLAAEAASFRISVTDAGPGIPLEDQARIWELHYRGQMNNGAARQNGGLGIGLFISRIIIERHGGQIGVASSPGQGATFWFTLPYIAESRLEAQPESDGAGRPGDTVLPGKR